MLYKIVDEKAYQIVFTDRTGKVIDGLNGRTVRVKVPTNLTSGVNETLMGTAVDSGVELCETIVSDDGYSYIYAEFSGLSGHFILAAPTTAEDSYWNGIIVKTDTTDDTEADTSDDLYDDDYSFSTVTNSETTDTDNETESTDTTPNKVKKHKKVAHVIEGYEAWVLPVIIVSCVLGAAAVVFVILLIVKKKKKIR